MFLPLKDHNPTRTKPYVTVGIIALCSFVFLLELAQGSQLSYVIARWGAMPYQFTHLGQVELVGRGLPQPVAPAPFWITGLTSMFLHGGWAHILFNMLFLWIFGNNVEDYLGHLRYLVFYLATGFIGLGTHILLHPASTVPVIGASGAISGVLGAYMVLYPRARVTTLVFLIFFITFIEVPAVVLLGLWILLQVFSGLGSLGSSGGGTAHWAHIGGFAAGYLYLRLRLAKKHWAGVRAASTPPRAAHPPFSPPKDYPPPPPRVGHRFGGDPIERFLEQVEHEHDADES